MHNTAETNNTAQPLARAGSDFGWSSVAGRAAMRLLSPGKGDARLSILIYHRVLPARDPLFPGEVDAQDFERQMRLVQSSFNIIPLADAVRALRNKTLPPRAACITFDDGYADNAEVALPILRRLGIPATFFIATGFLDGGRMWNDTVIELVRAAPGPLLDLEAVGFGRIDVASILQRQQAISSLIGKLKYLPLQERQDRIDAMCDHASLSLPDKLMMTSGQVRELHGAGMEIGGHTVNHPILARLDAKAARREIAEGKEALEGIIGAPVRLFAYPNGKPARDYLAEHVGIVRELGFDAAVSTAWGATASDPDLYQLPRFTPWDQGANKFLLRMGRNLLKRAERV
ncbi:polysaccharide deacetylase family protein [Noviherbaspirillum denitrificans]|nr:polysaccharide deacetylase family protein [Noviherbaspirillum denitrificans]